MSVQPSDLLQYLPEFKVVVCTSCQYALQPNAISRHLKDIHHILRSRRKPFMQYVSTLELNNPETVLRSTDDLKAFPVPLLPVQDGWKCNHRDCSHMCVTEKRMQHHWTVEHDRPGRPQSDWSSAPLQTFFRGNSLRYFTRPSLLPVQNGSLKTILIKEQEDALLQHYIACTSLTLVDRIGTPADSPTVATPHNTIQDDVDFSRTSRYGHGHSPKVRGANIWQETFPQLAEKSPFLMHGILACSALHLAYLHPSEKQTHLITAARYQELAMPPFREAVANIDTQNCNAIFAFAHLLVICSLASEQENERLLLVDPESPDVLTHWMSFLRIGCAYASAVHDHIERGPLRPLMCDWGKPVDPQECPRTPLVERLLGVIPSQDCEDAWSEKECQVYRDAVHKLGYAFVRAEELGTDFNTWEAAKVWPVLVSLDYFQLLQNLHPGALIVLANYCVLLHRLEGRWYLEGRAKRLSGHILQRLDPKWHSHVKWPME